MKYCLSKCLLVINGNNCFRYILNRRLVIVRCMEIGEIKFLSLLRRYFIFENTVERLKSSRDYLFFFLNPLFKNGLTKQKSSTNHVKLLNLGEGIKISQRRID